MMKCSKCGAEFEGKFCPECGNAAETMSQNVDNNSTAQAQPVQEPIQTPQQPVANKKKKKPFYKRWLFIVIAIIAILIIGGKIIGGGSDKTEKIDWSKMELGELLPEPPANKGKIWDNTEEELQVDLNGVSKDDYSDYVKACENKGYTIDADKTDWSYDAYNKEGYKLRLSIISEKMSIELNAPMKLSSIEWPTSKVGKLLPTPKSAEGKFSFENESSFYVYIGNTTIEDYNDYVKACSDAGFNVDYNKGDKYYHADNSDGYSLSVEYAGNNIMTIRIDSPDEDESTETSSTESTTSAEKKTNESKTTEGNNDTNLVNGMRKDFKEAMDSYEKFMDEYVAFMKKYQNNPSDLSLLTDYATWMSKYTDMCDKFDKWESEDLNSVETAYYIDVQARVSKKLLEVAS